MRALFLALSLMLGSATIACRSGGEYVPPLRSIGEGVPADLPALGASDFAVLRLVVNG